MNGHRVIARELYIIFVYEIILQLGWIATKRSQVERIYIKSNF